MINKFIFPLLCTLLLILSAVGCANVTTQTSATAIDKPNLPRESFVYIEKTLIARICTETGCIEKSFDFMASGAAINTTNYGTYILTAGHVCHTPTPPKNIKLKTKYSITNVFGHKYSAKVIEYTLNENLDICMLYTKGKIKPVSIADGGPVPGEKVYNLAAPLGIFNPGMIPVLEGRFAGFRENHAIYTIPAAPGSSGSGIFNRKGELVGLIHSVYTSFNNLSLSVSYSDLRRFSTYVISKYSQLDNTKSSGGCNCNCCCNSNKASPKSKGPFSFEKKKSDDKTKHFQKFFNPKDLFKYLFKSNKL